MTMIKMSSIFGKMGERSRNSITSVISSFGARGVSVLASLLIVPMTITYINSTQYGIWLTLSSIVGWVSFFDLGLGNGLRNKFAESKAKGETSLARQYVSTAYMLMILIAGGLLILIEVANCMLDWTTILNVNSSYFAELRAVFAVLIVFFCLNIIVTLFVNILRADQKPGIAEWITALGNLIALGVIFLLIDTTEGSLLRLATYYSGVPAIVILLASIYAFHFTHYKKYAPQRKYIRWGLSKGLMGLGVQFFIIYICNIIIFQMVNIVISRELGPDDVTEYNIAYKYFNLARIVIGIINVPFWSAFTDAYNKDDFNWMRKAKKSLEYIWLLEILGLIVMVLLSQWFYSIWVGSAVQVRTAVSIAVATYAGIHGISVIYMNLISGIGTIRMQLLINVIFSLFSLPLMIFSCRVYGITGIIVVPCLVFLTQALFGRIQLKKLLTKTATGVWIK